MIRYKSTILATAVGAILGLAYYKLIGCQSGTCPLTGTLWRSMGYFAVAGFVAFFPSIRKNNL